MLGVMEISRLWTARIVLLPELTWGAGKVGEIQPTGPIGVMKGPLRGL